MAIGFVDLIGLSGMVDTTVAKFLAVFVKVSKIKRNVVHSYSLVRLYYV